MHAESLGPCPLQNVAVDKSVGIEMQRSPLGTIEHVIPRVTTTIVWRRSFDPRKRIEYSGDDTLSS